MLTKGTLNAALGHWFPEKRLFLRSDQGTRFVRLSPASQVMIWSGGTLIIAWSIVATAMVLTSAVGSGDLREQARRAQSTYEARLNALSQQRDARTRDAEAAHQRFTLALGQISQMQSALLASEERRGELSKGIEIIQATLRETMRQRDQARHDAARMGARLADNTATAVTDAGRMKDEAGTVDFLSAALTSTADERDQMAQDVAAEAKTVDELLLEAKLTRQRNDHIFSRLEDAVTVSLAPMDKMFRAVGMPPDQILKQIREGYSGQGGALTPLAYSTKGGPPDADSLRANGILAQLDRVNMYRIAAEKLPLSLPLKTAFRYTSGFGYRHDPFTGKSHLHKGTDFASGYGTPIYATADGVVVKAGWGTGYGRVVEIRHAFGLQTRYAHMSKIRVKAGQRVSRGDRIGDMGSSGRSTGTHLHYEIRVNGKAINPMIYIKAAQDVL